MLTLRANANGTGGGRLGTSTTGAVRVVLIHLPNCFSLSPRSNTISGGAQRGREDYARNLAFPWNCNPHVFQ